ncbi:MAG: 23S rRNA (uracil(1939)-C(5))-methyltransferase RlmD [Pseudohongiella sp.]|nr:23S rRNA (uracil(1939)-C(5))-methyltransferase RlmD [Pseudohongiella sp.]MDO9519623.1 23S rRNA (uracil(1939)-C(5))-methyltransferase RlmD [Pseudohongiella sp.]MDP2127682.1 23S rRNA (uracil(1939)-C(5))-methyltransferase RlmD [Pseudohongiella sp.]
MSNNRRRRQSLPAEPITLNIERLSHEGRGVARNDGKIAFVDGALPGETVTAVYTSRRSQFDELNLKEVIVAAPNRINPPCAVAGICGGCLLQHLHSDGQLAHKQQVLIDQLKHTAHITQFEVLPAMASVSQSYRRKARLAVRYVHKKGEVLVGFREKANTFITNMNYCTTLVEPVGKLIAPLRKLLFSLEGCRDIPQIEVAVGETASVETGKLDSVLRVTLTLRHLQPLSETDTDRLKVFSDEHQIEWYLQSGGPDTIVRLWPQSGDEQLHYYLPGELGDIKMSFYPGDFTQVNAEINRRMILQAISLLDLQPDDRVLDLFCGLGNFSLPMAKRCASVTGVEGSQDMVERAAINASNNQLSNTAFYAADLFTEFDKAGWAVPEYSKILLDPPRSGAIEIVSRIRDLLPEVIVYVSCNPATLARDAAELEKQGYKMTHAGVMDMFPHTGHVESMARFKRIR